MCYTGSVHAGLTHGLSRMTGNCQVRFLGEGAAAMPFPYPTIANCWSQNLGNGAPKGSLSNLWWPDLRTNQTSTILAIMVRF